MAERQKIKVIPFEVQGRTYPLPVYDKFFSLTTDQQFDDIAAYLQHKFPREFSKQPSIDRDEYNAAGASLWKDGKPIPSYAAQVKWMRDNPEAYKLKRWGDRFGLAEGATFAHAGEIKALAKNIFGGSAEEYRRDVAKTEIPYKIYERIYAPGTTKEGDWTTFELGSLSPQVTGGMGTGAGIGSLLKTLVKTAPKAWSLLTGGEKVGRAVTRTLQGAGAGWGGTAAYRHGAGEGGYIGGEDDPLRTWQRFRTAAFVPEAAYGALLGAAIPAGIHGTVKVGKVFDKNVSPYLSVAADKFFRMFGGRRTINLLEKEKELATQRAVDVLRADTKALERKGLVESDPETGLPMRDLERASLDPDQTLAEVMTAPGLVPGHVGRGPVPVAFGSTRQEGAWSMAEPSSGAAHAAALQRRGELSQSRIVDDLYEGSLASSRNPDALMREFRESLERVYNEKYGRSYLVHHMPAGGTVQNPLRGGFRDLLKRSQKSPDKKLVHAWNAARRDIEKRLERNAIDPNDGLIHGVLPKRLSSVKEFLETPGSTLGVAEAHLVAKELGQQVKRLRATAEGTIEQGLINEIDDWTRYWNKAIDKHTISYTKARTAFRTGVVYDEALAKGRKFTDYRNKEELELALDSLEVPTGVTNRAEVEGNLRKLFVSGALEEARAGVSPSALLRDEETLGKLRVLLGDGYDSFKSTLEKEVAMSSFSGAIVSRGAASAEQKAARGATMIESLPHDIAMFQFAKMFMVGRKAGEIMRRLRGLENQRIGVEFQNLMLSTDPASKVEGVKLLFNYARVAKGADATIMSNVLRIGSTPVQEGVGLIP